MGSINLANLDSSGMRGWSEVITNGGIHLANLNVPGMQRVRNGRLRYHPRQGLKSRSSRESLRSTMILYRAATGC